MANADRSKLSRNLPTEAEALAAYNANKDRPLGKKRDATTTYTSRDLARDVVKKRNPDSGQSETDYSRGVLRARNDRNNIQTGKGKDIPTVPSKWPWAVKKAKAV